MNDVHDQYPENYHYSTKPSYNAITIDASNDPDAINLSNTIHGCFINRYNYNNIIKQSTLGLLADKSGVSYGLCTLSLYKGIDFFALRGQGDMCTLRIQYYA